MSDITALVVTSEGDVTEVTIPKGGFVQAFRQYTGARSFDKVSPAEDIDIWVDDEGLIVSEPDINIYATAVRDAYWLKDPRIDRDALAKYPPMAGTAIITGGATPSGDTKSLSQANISYLTRQLAGLKTFMDKAL